jgi:Skp family chaperone for outer membrane proteins
MGKQFLFIFLVLIEVNTFQGQTRGTKVGYIDMEYILQNVPNYAEAQNQLEQKAQKWKQEIEVKKTEINKLKDALKAEKALLTKGLIEERVAEIAFLENENLEYQQKRFGPNGDLMTQKQGLTKPIQDQVFTAVQDIAEAKKYDFIFDKTSDLTMLFAAKRFDISDQIVRILNRTEKREQLTKKQLKDEEAKEAKEDAMYDNPALANKQKSLDAKKAAREAVIANRLSVQEERRKAAEDRKLQIVVDREAKKNGTAPSTAKTAPTTDGNTIDKEAAAAAAAEAKQAQANQRAETLRVRQQAVEDRKKALEERRQQILDEREAKKSGTSPATSTNTPEAAGNPDAEREAAKTAAATSAAEAKQKQADARAKTLEDRKKVAEENKKAQEEKRQQALAAKKTGTISENTVKETEKSTVAEPSKTADSKEATAEEAKQKQADAKAKTIEERNKAIEERKKALEEKRKKILEDREAAKKANEEKLKTTKQNTNNN